MHVEEKKSNEWTLKTERGKKKHRRALQNTQFPMYDYELDQLENTFKSNIQECTLI